MDWHSCLYPPLRALYQKRDYHKLHTLIWVGVSTVAELVLSSASPFNVVDELRIPYFTLAQVGLE